MGLFGENFPYTNFHDMNLDWIIKIAKDFLDQYTNIQTIIENGTETLNETISSGTEQLGETTTEGLQTLNEKATELEGLLNEWYTTHSEDIANELADALADIRGLLAQAMNQFHADADVYVHDLIETIPADYTDLANTVAQIDIKSFINLYNAYSDGVTTGGYYNYLGQWSANPNFMSTDFIPVTAGGHYMLSSFREGINSRLQVVFFNSSKTFVSGINSEPNTYIEVPSSIYYMKVALPINDRYRVSIVQGEIVPPEYLPFYDKAIDITNIRPEIRIVKNLYNKDATGIETGGYYNYLNEWSVNANWMETDYIPIEPDELYVGSFFSRYTMPHQICFYDSGKNFITGWQSIENGIIKTPYNASYLRLPVNISIKDSFSFVKGTVPPPSNIPYNKNVFIIDEIILNGEQLEDKLLAIENAISAQTNYIGIQWSNKTWYCYGTSISNSDGEGKYSPYLEQFSNMNLVNKGISGGGIGNLGAYSDGQVYEAICNTTDGKTSADLITLETGANDIDLNVPLGTIYDTGRTTLAGCLNDCIRYLQGNTDAQIVIIPSPPGTITGALFEKYMEWMQMIEKICYINNCHFIKANDNVGYGKAQSSKKSLYISDNIHQTSLGGYVFAENIWYQLRNIPLMRTTIPG